MNRSKKSNDDATEYTISYVKEISVINKHGYSDRAINFAKGVVLFQGLSWIVQKHCMQQNDYI
ncbi:MAG: hypothetical protein JO297_18370 [Nitrososphaeraceae archaeon]|nr:hypothetical protein [Nitrososphaeraceae archaeon]